MENNAISQNSELCMWGKRTKCLGQNSYSVHSKMGKTSDLNMRDLKVD